ncbi:HAD family hydrolase [Streptomyces varsoviensis]|uniref:Hydrolase n=1 Tax=Streptomyces varsoviensis TaxID=67373 RepID=A0ABR5IY03_9ACTN|nr:HAD-IA family hydrolase [Streptomyces varsoviensis]KOG86043.1 hydrolase [Streptomyces varsoviensis]
MTVKGVLFDFSGTLLHVETARSWLRAALRATETHVDEEELDRLARLLDEAGALPGGSTPRAVPARLADAWARRDEDANLHRVAYLGLARQVPLPNPELYEALYVRHKEPAAWQPYPDAAEVLGELRRRGVRTAVVSNVGWDLRPVFRAHGLDGDIEAYVLSYEHGVQKPGARLFQAACDALGLAPGDTLMVGDDPYADAGAAAIGCAVHLVDKLPPAERPDALRRVLDLVG